jgi:hypothetical protein
MTGPVSPRVGYWGRANLARFGELGRFLVFEEEIRRRIPAARVHAYAPLGPRVPHGGDAGFGVADLGDWSARRASELAETLDCIVIGGDGPLPTTDAAASSGYGMQADDVRRTRPSSFFVEAVGTELETRCPVVWDAIQIAKLDVSGARRLRDAVAARSYLSVRDDVSRVRLARAGIERGVTVVPDPLILLPRSFAREVLARRLEFVRHMEWFPLEGEPLVLHGSRSLVKSAEAIAEVVAEALSKVEAPLVLLELDPGSGEGEFLDAVARVVSAPVFRVPSEASFLDRVTVLAHARCFLGSSAAGQTVAAAFGVPSVRFESGAPDAASVDELLRAARPAEAPSAEVETRLAEHFDALTGIVVDAWSRRVAESPDSVPRLVVELQEAQRRLDGWRTAHEARSREVVEGRLRMAALLEAEKSDVAVHFDKLTEELARVRGEQQEFYVEAEKVSKDAAATRIALEAAEARASKAADEVARLRLDHERVEAALAQSRERIRVLGLEIERARDETALARAEGERRTERARAEVSELRADLDRAEARLDVLRSEEAELRTTQTLLFTELAEARAELGRSAREQDPS